MNNFHESRTSRRARFLKPVQFECCEIRAGRFTNGLKAGNCIDISGGGVGLTTDFPLREGEVLKLHVPIDVADARLPIYTEVMWSRHVHGEYRAGLRFLA